MYRINELIKLDRRLYHTNDLAILWGVSNKNTLYTTIKRYVQKEILIPVYKGLCSTIPLSQLNPLEMGVAIVHKYAYLSTESVLAQKRNYLSGYLRVHFCKQCIKKNNRWWNIVYLSDA